MRSRLGGGGGGGNPLETLVSTYTERTDKPTDGQTDTSSFKDENASKKCQTPSDPSFTAIFTNHTQIICF